MAPPDMAHPSFQSGFRQLVGYEVETIEEGAAILVLELDDRHLNRTGITHGGVISTLIDAAMGYAGCYAEGEAALRRAATLSFTTSFLRPTKTGKIRARATVKPGGRQIFFATAEVHDEAGHLVAIGEGTYKYRSRR